MDKTKEEEEAKLMFLEIIKFSRNDLLGLVSGLLKEIVRLRRLLEKHKIKYKG